MNQFLSRRFTKGLSSVLSSVAIVAIGYCLSGNVESVNAADNSAATSKSSQDNSIVIPGTFKDLPGAKDAVTSKRSVAELEAGPANPPVRAQLTIDENKGVTINPNKGVAISPAIE